MLKINCLVVLFFLLSYNAICQQTLSGFLQKDLTNVLLQQVDSLNDVIRSGHEREQHLRETIIMQCKEAMQFTWLLQKLEDGQQAGLTNTDSSFVDALEFADNKLKYAAFHVYAGSVFSEILGMQSESLSDSAAINNLLLHFPKLQKLFAAGNLKIDFMYLAGASAPEIKLPTPSLAGKGKSIQDKKRILDEQMRTITLRSTQNHCPQSLLQDYMKEEAKIPVANLDKKIESRNKFLAFIILNCH